MNCVVILRLRYTLAGSIDVIIGRTLECRIYCLNFKILMINCFVTNVDNTNSTNHYIYIYVIIYRNIYVSVLSA